MSADYHTERSSDRKVQQLADEVASFRKLILTLLVAVITTLAGVVITGFQVYSDHKTRIALLERDAATVDAASRAEDSQLRAKIAGLEAQQNINTQLLIRLTAINGGDFSN